jgi:hypothetical protein
MLSSFEALKHRESSIGWTLMSLIYPPCPIITLSTVKLIQFIALMIPRTPPTRRRGVPWRVADHAEE